MSERAGHDMGMIWNVEVRGWRRCCPRCCRRFVADRAGVIRHWQASLLTWLGLVRAPYPAEAVHARLRFCPRARDVSVAPHAAQWRMRCPRALAHDPKSHDVLLDTMVSCRSRIFRQSGEREIGRWPNWIRVDLVFQDVHMRKVASPILPKLF